LEEAVVLQDASHRTDFYTDSTCDWECGDGYVPGDDALGVVLCTSGSAVHLLPADVPLFEVQAEG
jgi:hypothetical protein